MSYTAIRQSLAQYSLDSYDVIEVIGPDREQFLQGQTSNDIKGLEVNHGHYNALLDHKAHVIALFFLYKLVDRLLILCPKTHSAELIERLDKFIIMDELELIAKPDLAVLAVSGPQALEQFPILKDLPETYQCIEQDGLVTINQSFTGEDGLLFIADKEQWPQIDLPVLSVEDQEVLRIEAGFVDQDQDINEKTLLPETNLQNQLVSYTKGCFVGQEIVARVKYRGSANKSLMGLIFDDAAPAKGAELSSRGKKAASVKSSIHSPQIGKNIALAYLRKDYRVPGSRHAFEAEDGQVYKATVAQLPFYQHADNIEEAQELFDQAMDIFASSNSENDIEAIPYLRKAIFKNPKMADAYETLGVLLSRHERYDEAIEVMKQLKEISPDEVMAYSNLSVFYMKKNMIQEAEDEKTQATLATFRKAAAERKQRLDEDKIKAEQKIEIKRRMGMFEQVLEIDEEDLVANFGMGKAFHDLEEYDKAIPYLKKSLEIKKNYSVAFLLLGKSYLKSGDKAQAKETFQAGIIEAAKNGDLMPKNEMESLLPQC